MILDGKQLAPPWLEEPPEESPEENHNGMCILRLGYQGVGYEATTAEAERATRIHRHIGTAAILVFCGFVGLYAWQFIINDRPESIANFLSTLLYFTLVFGFMNLSSLLYFRIVKGWMQGRQPIDDGLGFWEMKARERDNGSSQIWSHTIDISLGSVLIALNVAMLFFGWDANPIGVMIGALLFLRGWQTYMITRHLRAHQLSH
ncbi:hypothetical protein [Kordiimonas sp. SCSIO 12610]|uniref:hypothetical protein n=1 Tax=Kordiimonas sp. SCSIO 12610 TaxID=2829597 RepID=UPI00210D27F4|nr:hypothetical protein [Kordiimonas sp. SCSIO 12610]UTW56127.1 hypothetical protein KFF44_04320 [Kordiimonas sp. SCSIO 12610]